MIADFLIYLETQKQIKFNDIIIYQPPLNEIIDYGVDKYNMLLVPFLLDVSDFDFADESIIEKISIFDILTLEQNLPLLLNSIGFFCKVDEMSFDEQKGTLYIGENGFIDKNNFAEFAEIILQINAKQKPKKEIPPKNMTDKQRDIWEKLQAGRRKAMEKSQIDLCDLISICQFGGHYYISMSEILQWTMFNLTRCYKSIIGKSNYQDLFDIYIVTGEEKLIKNQHWTDLIKINNNKEE